MNVKLYFLFLYNDRLDLLQSYIWEVVWFKAIAIFELVWPYTLICLFIIYYLFKF